MPRVGRGVRARTPVLVAVLGAALVAGPARSALAASPVADTAPELAAELDRVGKLASRVTAEYRVSLRRADRWLARGDEKELWDALVGLREELQDLDDAVSGLAPVELEGRLRSALERFDEVELVYVRVPTSRSVQRRWRRLAQSISTLRDQRVMLAARNRVFPDGYPDADSGASGYERVLDEDQAEAFVESMREAEDLSNRLKAHVRLDWPRTRAPETPASVEGAKERHAFREAVLALERHLDAVVDLAERRGLGLVRPELERSLLWARRASEAARSETVPDAARRDFTELVVHLRVLAELYELPDLQ